MKRSAAAVKRTRFISYIHILWYSSTGYQIIIEVEMGHLQSKTAKAKGVRKVADQVDKWFCIVN